MLYCARNSKATTNAGKVARVWSAAQPQTLQTREKLPTFGAKHHTKPSKREKSCAQMWTYTRSKSTKLTEGCARLGTYTRPK